MDSKSKITKRGLITPTFQMMKQEYEPYGDEWIKEISKGPKKWIVEELYKPSAMRVTELEKQVEMYRTSNPHQMIAELKEFAIWMTGCYDFTQHEYFIKKRDELLK